MLNHKSTNNTNFTDSGLCASCEIDFEFWNESISHMSRVMLLGSQVAKQVFPSGV